MRIGAAFHFVRFAGLGLAGFAFLSAPVAEARPVPATEASEGLGSPFPSSVDGLSIGNAHLVATSGEGGRLYRGMRPRRPNEYAELKKLGVNRVVIFKNFVRGQERELGEERRQLERLGLAPDAIVHLPMPWKDVRNYAETCGFVTAGLAELEKSFRAKEGAAYFHCTVGEDRTGLLAGLVRQLSEGWDVERAFREEMCRWGFAEGNPRKPPHVAQAVRKDLVPLYLKLSWAIERGQLRFDPKVEASPVESIHGAACAEDPEKSPEYRAFARKWQRKLVCATERPGP